MSVEPSVDLEIKTLDAEIPVFLTDLNLGQLSTGHRLRNVMFESNAARFSL